MNFTDQYSCYDGRGLSYNSVTTEYWTSEDTPLEDTALVSAIVTLCFILVGTPSNLLIIVSILWQNLYRQPTYILLLNLAIVDLLMCVLVMPFTVISGFAGGFIFGNTDIIRCRVCKLGILFTLFALLTIHILALLAVDRFIFIKWALKYHKIVNTKYISIACLCIWIYCCIISSIPLFGFGDVTFRIDIASCVIEFEEDKQITTNTYYAFFVALIGLIPLIIIIVTNAWILCIIQKQLRKMYSLIKSTNDISETRKNIKLKLKNSKHIKQLQLIKVFGAIWIANMITWIPFLIRTCGSIIFDGNKFSNEYELLAFIGVVSFAVVHPTIQAIIIPEFRKYIVIIMKKILPSNCSSLSFTGFDSETGRCSCHRGCHCKLCSIDCFDMLNAAIIPNYDA